MTSNVDTSVQQIAQDFQALITYVTGPETRTASAYTVELTLFRRLLALGAALLRVFFQTRAAARPAGPVHAPDGTALAYHDCRPLTYYSVFGKVRFARHFFTALGQEGVCPLDAALSLPARCYSDLLQEWGSYGTTDASYHESQAALRRILDLPVSGTALEMMVADAVADVEAFYAQPISADVRANDGPILVVQADGKGVPMVQPPASGAARRPRLGKGQKRTKKKEAVVTSLYTIAPYVRTPQEVVAALLQDRDRPPEAARPKPMGKELRATLAGKTVALTRLVERARPREGPHIHDHVALTDGAEALQKRIETHFPQHTLVLDIIHATDYLWDAANARAARPGCARTWRPCSPARRTPSSRRWRRPRRSRGAPPHNVKPSCAPLATIVATRPTCSMMCISPRAGRWARGLWRVPVGTSSRIGWNKRACAGPKRGPKPCSTCAPSGSTASGTPMDSSIASSNINDCMGPLASPQRWWRCRCWLTRPSRVTSTDFGHTRIKTRPWLSIESGPHERGPHELDRSARRSRHRRRSRAAASPFSRASGRSTARMCRSTWPPASRWLLSPSPR